MRLRSRLNSFIYLLFFNYFFYYFFTERWRCSQVLLNDVLISYLFLYTVLYRGYCTPKPRGGGGKALVVRTNAPFYPPAGFKGVFVPGFGAFDLSQWCKPL